MIIVLWLVLGLLFLTTAILLLIGLWQRCRRTDTGEVFFNGIKDSLKDCGFNISKRKCPVELYKWVNGEDDDVCSACIKRCQWPAMDIADWMKEGLPRSSDGTTLCGRDCHCRLVRHKKETQPTIL